MRHWITRLGRNTDAFWDWIVACRTGGHPPRPGRSGRSRRRTRLELIPLEDRTVLNSVGFGDMLDSVRERDSGTFSTYLCLTLELVSWNGSPVSVDYTTSDGTATAGSDYTPISGTWTCDTTGLPLGYTGRLPSDGIIEYFGIIGDTVPERDETINITLSNPVNATLSATSTTFTIIDDDLVANDDRVSTAAGSAVTVDVLKNDTYPPTVDSVGTPHNGTAAIVSNKVVYTPNSGFSGKDEFTYTVTNSLGINATAKVYVEVSNALPDPVLNTDCGCAAPGDAVGTGPGAAPAAARGQFSANPVRYADGVVRVASADLTSSAFGDSWGYTRSWTNDTGAADWNYDPEADDPISPAPGGSGQAVTQFPRLVGSDSLMALVSNGVQARFFSASGGGYAPALGARPEAIAHDAVNHRYVLTDSTGQVLRFYDFTATPAERGRLASITGPDGSVTSVTYDADGRATAVGRSRTVGGVAYAERQVLAYVPAGFNKGNVDSVTLQRQTGGGGWETVQSVAYVYYMPEEDYGTPGDLKTAVVTTAGGGTETKYYRYYDFDEANGVAGGLKFVFEGAAYDRLVAAVGDPEAADDEAVRPYANNYFEYDSDRRVTKEVAGGAGCSVCAGGQGEFDEAYTASGNPLGYNSWATKTVETMPDGNQNVVYTNGYGQVMLFVYKDTTTDQEWATYYRYDEDGRVILTADPSAVTGYDDGYADLVHFVSDNAEYLSDESGRLTAYTYYSSTTATDSAAGGVEGYQKGVALRHGEQPGVPPPVESPQSLMDYITHTDANGVTVYNVANSTVYRNDDGTGAIVTSYAYTYYSGTNAVESVTTTLPEVGNGQNGSGAADTAAVVYDVKGRPVWSKDQAGVIGYTEYDPSTGAVVKTIADVDTAEDTDFADLPDGWETVLGAGQHRVTTFEVDSQGRVTKETDPDGTVTYTVYDDAAREVRVYAAWDDVADAPRVPITVYREDRGNGYTETLTMTATPDVDGSGKPLGTEAIDGLVSLSRSIVNDVGQVVATRDYFDLTGLTYDAGLEFGTEGTNYYETGYAYDALGRQSKTVSPGGTIYRTVFDGMGRTVSEWVGTNDTPGSGYWSPDNAAGMVQVAGYEYDLGGVGDSNLTRLVRFTGSVAAPDQVTEYAYDWRGRAVGTKSGVEVSEAGDVNRPITISSYDNLGNVTRVQVYDGDGEDLTDAGELVVPSSGLLRAQSRAYYDDLGRVYKTETDGVDPSDGTVGNTLTSETWYDARGLVVKQTAPNSPVAKFAYDSLGQLTAAYTTDGADDADYADALSVDDDTVLEQTEYDYDAMGRTIQTTARQRFHDATGAGPLGDPDSTLVPKARVYYTGAYYDGAGRLAGTVDVGTNGGDPWTRPGSLPPPTATELVTTYEYGTDGRLLDVTDPAGVVTRTTSDALGRTLSTVEDYGGQAKTTEYGYGRAGMTTLTAVNPGGVDQVTEWVYGVTVLGGSGIDSNDIVGATWHPDPTTGEADDGQADAVTVTALGQTLTSTDRNGTEHTLAYDALGRLVTDVATELGTGVDGAVRRREYRYDTLGNGVLFTTFDTVEAGDIVTQVQRAYNGFGQLTREWQSHTGVVDAPTTPAVGYAYSEGDGGNHSRLTSMTYPDGREVDYNYGSTDDLDDTISRLTSISDPSGTLEAYTYLGLGTVVVRSHPLPDIDLTYVKQGMESVGDAGDPYTGLDRFGRVADQRWVDGNGDATDRFQYGYDEQGNRTYRDNLVDVDFGEVYTYDSLGQLLTFDRGELNGTKDGITGTVARSQAWDLDAQGNWDTLTTDGVGEDRTHDAQNRITAVEGEDSPAFDAAGNMTADETGKTFAYDAWNRLVSVSDATPAVVAAYAYDALGRRVSQTYDSGTTDLYYSAAWQVLEERSRGEDELLDSGFEDVSAGGYTYNPTGGDWTFTGDSGLSENGTALTSGNPNAPEGDQVAFLQNAGSMSQTVSLAAGTYSLTFRAAQQAGSDPQTVEVVVDSVVVATITPTGTDYLTYGVTFAVSAGSHTIELRGTTTNDEMAFVDAVRLGATPTTAQYVWSPVYVDAMIERDWDADNDGETGEGGLEERVWVQQDANWNVTALVDDSGDVQERFVYDAFGARAVLDANWGVDLDGVSDYGMQYGDQGLRHDAVVMNHVYARNRILDVHLGRPITSDPLQFDAEDVNFYRWEGNGPTDRLDPSGLRGWSIWGGVLGAVGGSWAGGLMLGPGGAAMGLYYGAIEGARPDPPAPPAQDASTDNHIKFMIESMNLPCQKAKDKVYAAVKSLVDIARLPWDGQLGFLGDCAAWQTKYFSKMAATLGQLRKDGIVGCVFEVDPVSWGNNLTFGTAGHNAIRIHFVDGTNIYLDDGNKGGTDHVFLDNEVPWNYTQITAAKPTFGLGALVAKKCKDTGRACVDLLCD